MFPLGSTKGSVGIVLLLVLFVFFVVEFEEFVAFPAVLFPVLLFVEFSPCNLWTLFYLSSLIKESSPTMLFYKRLNSVLFISAN
jgi:ABC-type microcin C transport system permease subunit YejB